MELEQSFKQALSAKDSLEDLIAKEGRKKFTIDVLKASSAGTVFSGSTLMLQGSVIGALISGISVLAALYDGGNAASYLKQNKHLSDLSIKIDSEAQIVRIDYNSYSLSYNPLLFNENAENQIKSYLDIQIGFHKKLIKEYEEDLKKTITYNVSIVSAQRELKKLSEFGSGQFFIYKILSKFKFNLFLNKPKKDKQIDIAEDHFLSRAFSYGQKLFDSQLSRFSFDIDSALTKSSNLAKQCSYLKSSLALRGEQQINALEELATYY